MEWRSPCSDMKVSVRAGDILSPSLRPLAVGRATELCPALPETFLSLQGDLTSLQFLQFVLPWGWKLQNWRQNFFEYHQNWRKSVSVGKGGVWIISSNFNVKQMQQLSCVQQLLQSFASHQGPFFNKICLENGMIWKNHSVITIWNCRISGRE